MIVVVDGGSNPPFLDDADDLTGLRVELRGCALDLASRKLAGLGRLDADHVWLDIDALRALSPRREDPAWLAQFESSMNYAKSKGWTDDTGAFVRAHL